MKELLNYIPGFRNNNQKMKRLAIGLYSLHIVLAFIFGLEYFFIVGGIGQLITSSIDIINTKDNNKNLAPITLLIISIILLFSGFNIGAIRGKLIEETNIRISIEKEYKQLILENKNSKEEVETLKSENASLTENNKIASDKINTFKKENDVLKAENEKFVNEEKEREEAKKAEEDKLAEEAKKKEERKKLASDNKTKTTSTTDNVVATNNINASTSSQNKAPANNSSNTSKEVIITRTGSKYHRSSCPTLKSRIPTTLSNAIGKGLGACKVCKP